MTEQIHQSIEPVMMPLCLGLHSMEVAYCLVTAVIRYMD
jgi:hypothetical protein